MVGFIFGLLIHHASRQVIAIGGLGGAISATVSMGTGQFEALEGPWHSKMPEAGAMAISTLLGSLVPIWPFFFFGTRISLFLAAWGCAGVAGWIGYEKRRGIRGYVSAYVTLLLAVALTLGVVALIPQSA